MRQAKCNPQQVVKLLQDYYNQKKKNKYIKYNFSGKSFLLNPERLFKDSANDIYKTQYIILAAKRDFFMYRTYGVTSLELSYYPDLILDKIRTNTLLTITKTEIKFKFEE